MGKRKNFRAKILPMANEFGADVAPNYEDKKKRDFKKQGRTSFLDEFHTLYRKWIKNE